VIGAVLTAGWTRFGDLFLLAVFVAVGFLVVGWIPSAQKAKNK
jgi:hypothetical protein